MIGLIEYFTGLLIIVIPPRNKKMLDRGGNSSSSILVDKQPNLNILVKLEWEFLNVLQLVYLSQFLCLHSIIVLLVV